MFLTIAIVKQTVHTYLTFLKKMCSYHRTDTKQLPCQYSTTSSSQSCTCNMHKNWTDTVHNFDCLQFIYAEQLSLYVDKTTVCWQNKDWIFYNRIHNMLSFGKSEIFIAVSRHLSAVLCKNQSYKNRTFSIHFLREISSTIANSICFIIHMNYSA